MAAVINYWKARGCPEINWCNGEGLSFILYIGTCWFILYYCVIKQYLFPTLKPYCKLTRRLKLIIRRLQIIILILAGIGLVVFLIIDTASNRRRLLSFGGLFVFILLGFIFSKYPGQVRWRTVCVGVVAQLVIGLLTIRWDGGRIVFQCIGHKAEQFLNFGYVGAEMVYGNFLVIKEAVFAFQALSAIFFVGMVVQVMFYFGWMQIICIKLGWFVQISMGTTVIESVNVVASVFVGMSEAPLLYTPYIPDLTQSEIHAVMAGGFSTVAGTVFAAYTALGVNPAHVITASVMTAPAALCYAKLVFPENEKSKTDANTISVYKSDDKSIMDAMTKGASVGIGMIQGIIANIIACVSFVAFADSVLQWAGELVGFEGLSFEEVLSVILIPVAWIMGVEPSQCSIVARLIGIKVILNEFIAYKELGEIKKTGVLSARSEAIATYALCSFANPGSVGILTASLCSLCPEQRDNILAVAIRACLCAIVTSFLTACIAGLLMPEEGFPELENAGKELLLNATIINSTIK